MQAISQHTEGKLVAIDGKTLRSSSHRDDRSDYQGKMAGTVGFYAGPTGSITAEHGQLIIRTAPTTEGNA